MKNLKMISYDSFTELSHVSFDMGSCISEGKACDLGEIQHLLPEIEGYDYTDNVFLFKTIGSISPHSDHDIGTHSVFFLFDVFNIDYAETDFYFLAEKTFEMRSGDFLIFNHTEEHSVLTNSAWVGMSIILEEINSQDTHKEDII